RHKASGPIGQSAAVGMHEASHEFPRMHGDDVLLPALQDDRPVMFPARRALGEEARPVPAVAGDAHTTLALHAVCTSRRVECADRVLAGVDEAWPGVCTGDAQVVAAVSVGADTAVTEVEAEQVRVYAGGLGKFGCVAAPRAGDCAAGAVQGID